MSNDTLGASEKVEPRQEKPAALADAIRSIEQVNMNLQGLIARVSHIDATAYSDIEKQPSVSLLKLLNDGPESINIEVDRAHGLIRELTELLF